MSYWTHIFGVINVWPAGRTQHEMDYIVNTVLDHLPVVTGSEGDMEVFVNYNPHHNSSCSHDEFGMMTNNLRDRCGDRSRNRGWLETSDDYYLTVYGSFRDRMFNQTFREFQNWLCRLAKRLDVLRVNVTIEADDRREPYHIYADRYLNNPYSDMYEFPSWNDPEKEPSWYEYLLWEADPYSGMPMAHVYKYFNSDSVDTEMERRIDWREKRLSELDEE